MQMRVWNPCTTMATVGKGVRMPNLSNDVYDLLITCKDLELDDIHTRIIKRGHHISPQGVVATMVDLSRNYANIYEAVLSVRGLTLSEKLQTLILPLIKEPSIETIYSDMGTSYCEHWPWYVKNRKHHKKLYKWLRHSPQYFDRSIIWDGLASLQILAIDPKVIRIYCDLFDIKHYPSKGSLDLCESTEDGALTVYNRGCLTCI